MANNNQIHLRLRKTFLRCILVICVGITPTVVAKSVGKSSDKSMIDVISGNGLYNKTDKVVILDASTLTNAVTNSKQAWIVEFYNSWCGHCVRYAPIWKEFAASVYGWRNVAKVGVIDCVVEANTPICRDYDIMQYPTVKFFPAGSEKEFVGKAIDKGNTAMSLRKSLAEMLVKEQQEGRGTDWRNLSPYRSGNMHNLWKDVSRAIKYAVLIFTDKESDIGVELVLELSLVPSIQARVVLSDNEVLARALHVLTYPAVVITDANEIVDVVQTTDKSFKGLLIATQAALKLKGIEIPLKSESSKDTLGIDSPPATEHTYQKEARELIRDKDVAFFADMERAIRYALQHEIAVHNTVRGQSVYDFVNTIYHYFPLSTEKRMFFEFLLHDMERDPVVSGKQWKVKLSRSEMKVPGPVWGPWSSGNNGWLGCQGSQPKYRGYPCALWMTFHTLTVNAMDTGCQKQDAMSVLNAIHGYVTNFFGCSDCAAHFHQMVEDDGYFANEKSCEDGAKWLWKAHNRVNKRLQNDSSSDPGYPKVQFPRKERCEDCYNDSDWDEPNVLKYLSSIYGFKNINQLGSKYSSEEIKPAAESLHLTSSSSGWIMSPLDLSLCVVLYITSGIIIIFVWFKFIRRSYRKKAYIHDLLGKV